VLGRGVRRRGGQAWRTRPSPGAAPALGGPFLSPALLLCPSCFLAQGRMRRGGGERKMFSDREGSANKRGGEFRDRRREKAI